MCLTMSPQMGYQITHTSHHMRSKMYSRGLHNTRGLSTINTGQNDRRDASLHWTPQPSRLTCQTVQRYLVNTDSHRNWLGIFSFVSCLSDEFYLIQQWTAVSGIEMSTCTLSVHTYCFFSLCEIRGIFGRKSFKMQMISSSMFMNKQWKFIFIV